MTQTPTDKKHQWAQVGEGYGVGDPTGRQSSVGWTERCAVCLTTRHMGKAPAGPPHERSWVPTDPACDGPAPEHEHAMTAYEDGDISAEEAFGIPPAPRCQAMNQSGRPCQGDMSQRRGKTHCHDHE